MSSNGQGSVPESGIKAPDALASAMESINTLSVWLKDAGLDESAIAQWKFNALAKKFPDLADIIEDAKKLIGKSAPIPEAGMTVSEVAQRLSEQLGDKIKPAQVNQALVELGFQVRPDNGKRIWQLTQPGKEYGLSRLATSKTNDWSGPQVTWGEAVIPVLIDYFESTADECSSLQASGSSPDSTVVTRDGASNSSPPPACLPEPAPEEEAESQNWMVTARIKALKKKVLRLQRAAWEIPAKEKVLDKYHDVYPAADLDLLDAVIERVLKRYAKSS